MFLSSGWWSLWMHIIAFDVVVLLTVFTLVGIVKISRKRH